MQHDHFGGQNQALGARLAEGQQYDDEIARFVCVARYESSYKCNQLRY
jgi:hypothetical protein